MIPAAEIAAGLDATRTYGAALAIIGARLDGDPRAWAASEAIQERHMPDGELRRLNHIIVENAARDGIGVHNAATLSLPIDRAGLSDVADEALAAYPGSPAKLDQHVTTLLRPGVNNLLRAELQDIQTALENDDQTDAHIDRLRKALDDAESAIRPASDRFPAWTVPDILAYQPQPEQTHIVGNGWARRGAMTLLTGGTGLGKSVAVEQIAVSVSAGVPIFDRITVARPFNVCLIEAENDLDTLHRDLSAIMRHLSLSADDIGERLRIHHAHSVAGLRFHAYAERVLRAEPPDLMIVDNYQAFSGDDINSTEAWHGWISPLRRLIQQYNCSLLLVDHTTKPRADNGQNTARQSVYAAAGTSAKANAARASAELSECRDDERRFRLRFGKNAERAGMTDPDGRLIRDLFIEHSPSAVEPYWRLCDSQSPDGGKYDGEIMRLLEDKPGISSRAIAREIGVAASTVTRSRERLRL